MQGERCDGLIQIRAPRALIQTVAGEARKRELTFSSFVRRAVERELSAQPLETMAGAH
jgi:hypothetical protein